MKEVNCERCGDRIRVDVPRDSNAKMLRRSKEHGGICINCAVHDWLRNTYPPNMLLAESGPEILLYPHIQKLFAEIMQAGFADAKPDEIDWDRVVGNWDLPFPKKMRPSAMNPCSQKELEEIAAGKRPGLGRRVQPEADPLALGRNKTITSFEELNELDPGLGDEFKKCLRRHDG